MTLRNLIIPALVLLLFSACSQQKEETIPGDYTGKLSEEEIRGGIMTPEILWKFGRVSDHQLSPDQATVLFNVRRYDVALNKGRSFIYSVPFSGGEAINLTPELNSCFNQRWYPDGSRIGFLSSASGTVQLWEMRPDGSAVRQLSDIPGGIDGFEYSPDGSHIYYYKGVKTEKTPAEIYPDLPNTEVMIIEDLMYRHWDHFEDEYYSHIFIAPYSSEKIGEGTDIMPGERWDAPLSPYFDQSEISWSPDGKILAYTCKKLHGRDYAVSTNSDIYLYNLETGETRNISSDNPGYDKYPRFSPDGNRIAWQSMETPGYEADKDRLMLMDLSSGTTRYLTATFDQNVSNIAWADNSTLFFISGTHATFQIYRMNTETMDIDQITEGVHDYTAFTLAGEQIVAEKMSMQLATEVFVVDVETGEERQLSDINHEIYANIEMGQVEERWINTSDGKKMLTWIIYPPEFDSTKQYPALLYCQGGPQSAVSQFFSYRWNFQMMAANGYIIIAPNRRGLPTFGQEWNAEISGDYGGQNIRDYLTAVDEVKKDPWVDENRLGAVGASYGGFSVFYLAGNHNKRFKAFIAHCGIYNFESMYTATEETFFVNHDLEGPYWQSPTPKSYAWSPHRFVQNWDTPIMIVTGGRDFRIPYTESMQAFNAAQLRGIPSKLLFFPNETHFVVSPQNAILWQREFAGWLDRYLK
ncbi:MAG: S9 family peptidase [Bacteroidota bacterium]